MTQCQVCPAFLEPPCLSRVLSHAVMEACPSPLQWVHGGSRYSRGDGHRKEATSPEATQPSSAEWDSAPPRAVLTTEPSSGTAPSLQNPWWASCSLPAPTPKLTGKSMEVEERLLLLVPLARIQGPPRRHEVDCRSEASSRRVTAQKASGEHVSVLALLASLCPCEATVSFGRGNR